MGMGSRILRQSRAHLHISQPRSAPIGHRSDLCKILRYRCDSIASGDEHLRSSSDHVPIGISVDLDLDAPEIIRFSIKRGSEEDYSFTGAIIAKVAAIDALPASPGEVDAMAQAVADAFDDAWQQFARPARIVPESKPWWSEACQTAFDNYSVSREKEDWSAFRRAVREAKRNFFAERIQEVAVTNMRPWDLMEWVKQRKNPPCEAIQRDGEPCHDLEQLWDALHSSYNAASGRQCDVSMLDDLPDEPVREWGAFLGA